MKRKTEKKILFWAAFLFTLTILIKILPLPHSFKLFEDYSRIFFAKNNEILYIKTSPSGKYRFKTDVSSVSPVFLKMLLSREDRFFYQHPGINPLAFLKSLFKNIQSGKIVSGASTITMQAVRLNGNPPSSKYLRKLYEFFFSFVYEIQFSKDEILSFYLSTVPMGKNIEGIETASYFYFGRPSATLYYPESAVLLAVLNSPSKYNPLINPEKTLKKRNEILSEFFEKGFFSKNELEKFLSLPLLPTSFTYQEKALHYCLRLDEKSTEFYQKTDIDINLQTMVEEKLLLSAKKSTANNAAVIIYDHLQKKIAAYAGNPDYTNTLSRRMNAANAYRQPGSLLKPFIYASSFDVLGFTPDTLVYDIPINLGGYEPKNFSNQFIGLSHISFALAHSLNIPPILINRLLPSDSNLYAILKKTGFVSFQRPLNPKDDSAVLGSFLMTLEELTALYSVLGEKGDYEPLPIMPGSRSSSFSLFSKESVYLVNEILKKVKKPYLSNVFEHTFNHPDFAFKTGTSYGGLDAWSIGYDNRYTIAVWFGNLDNSYQRGLVGIVDAAPLLFQLFDIVYTGESPQEWKIKPEKIKKRKICALSGHIPNENCPVLKEGFYIEGVSSYEKCSIHRKEGKEVIEFYPEEVNDFLRKSGLYHGKNAFSSTLEKEKELKIKSVIKNQTYYLEKGQKNFKLPLTIYENQISKHLYWILNEEYRGESLPENTFYLTIDEGEYLIQVYDQLGNRGQTQIKVKRK